MFAVVVLVIACLTFVNGKVYNFAEMGGVHDDNSFTAVWKNGKLLNHTLSVVKSFDSILFPSNSIYYMMGGITGSDFSDVVFQFDGLIIFSNDTNAWPKKENGDVLECIHLTNITNVTFTSIKDSETSGMLDGSGNKWWGLPGLGYLRRVENRPRLFNVENSTQITVEYLTFKDSPYWTFWVHGVDGLVVRYSNITARRTQFDNHTLVDMTAFNTDGYDVSGNNVHIHDCEVWNQDDTIAVKDDSTNMLFERITASGVGLTIGSIGSSTVKNITFKDCAMHNTFKGIYLKFRDGEGGLIEDVLFQNISIGNPSQWPIWIGPAQQSDSRGLCAPHPCSLCWPLLENSECNAPLSQYRNIVLRDITIDNPSLSPGVIIGNSSMQMEGIVFDNVVVNNPPIDGYWGEDYYMCEGVKSGVATGKTWPVPPCFEDQTVME